VDVELRRTIQLGQLTSMTRHAVPLYGMRTEIMKCIEIVLIDLYMPDRQLWADCCAYLSFVATGQAMTFAARHKHSSVSRQSSHYLLNCRDK
jgi:hypothetical protein